MNEKKEFYKHILPHYQQPGQAYFVTWCLKDSVPPKALARYTEEQDRIRNQLKIIKKQDDKTTEKLKHEYYQIRRKYIHAFDNLLAQNQDNKINLNTPEISEIIIETMKFWEESRLANHAFCIMPNHVHWVFSVFEQDKQGNPVFLQDILQSVKRHSAKQINKCIRRKESLWQKESFDTTIRNEKHLLNAISYTLNNPVAAGFVDDWKNWKGSWFDPRKLHRINVGINNSARIIRLAFNHFYYS